MKVHCLMNARIIKGRKPTKKEKKLYPGVTRVIDEIELLSISLVKRNDVTPECNFDITKGKKDE